MTHLSRLLSSALPGAETFAHMTVWGGRLTLAALPERDWLSKMHVPVLDGPLPFRVTWQQFTLPKQLKVKSCDVLFSPGGTIPVCAPIPVVTMSQNLLPFAPKEMSYYSLFNHVRIRMAILRQVQAFSMRHAEGLIFLTNFAKDTILSLIARDSGGTAIISHGLEDRFFCVPREAKDITAFSPESPFRIRYVSIIDTYKHQIEVAVAAAAVRKKGFPIDVIFTGRNNPLYFSRFNSVLNDLDPNRAFLHYSGNLPFNELHMAYRDADLSILASSCENLPNVLLESMASGTPMACSNMGPMPEILGNSGIYFDPSNPEEIEKAIVTAISNPQLRNKIALESFERAKNYSWSRCAEQTFAFINKVAVLRNP